LLAKISLCDEPLFEYVEGYLLNDI